MSLEPPVNPMDTGAPCDFRTTHWSVITQVRHEDPQRVERALDELCRAYWAPLRTHAVRFGLRSHDAQDATQEFLKRLLEREEFARVRRDKGRFRTFLLTAFQHFLLNRRRDEQRMKRGGGHESLPLHDLDEHGADAPAVAVSSEAQREYDRQWAATVMSTALQRLELEYQDRNRHRLYAAIRVHLVELPSETASYAGTAFKLGMQPGAIGAAIFRLRERFRELIRQEVSRTVRSPEDLEDEMQYLQSVWDGTFPDSTRSATAHPLTPGRSPASTSHRAP